jgi:hypothetical protein
LTDHGTQAVHGEQRALGARGGHRAQLREIQLAAGDEPGGRHQVICFLARKLERQQVGGFEPRDGFGRGRNVQSVCQRLARALDQPAFQQAGEGEIDLLADDGPQQAVEHGRRLADAQAGPTGDEAGETELAYGPHEGGGILFQPGETHHERMGGERRARGNRHRQCLGRNWSVSTAGVASSQTPARYVSPSNRSVTLCGSRLNARRR